MDFKQWIDQLDGLLSRNLTQSYKVRLSNYGAFAYFLHSFGEFGNKKNILRIMAFALLEFNLGKAVSYMIYPIWITIGENLSVFVSFGYTIIWYFPFVYNNQTYYTNGIGGIKFIGLYNTNGLFLFLYGQIGANISILTRDQSRE